ncbi:MAG: hypothetical protein KGO48_06475 [Alphaproteobacteria bacterium]|nr:hypothetical protein [Alphaproteobacteria bacterium]
MQLRIVEALASLIILLASPNLWAAPTEHPLRKGESFLDARAALLNAGWLPVRIDKRMADGTRENQFGDGRLFFNAGFIEVQECTGTGTNPCILNYQKDGMCLRLVTEGEYLPERGSIPDVLFWSDDCPG